MSSLQVLPKTTNSNSGGATEPQCRYNASVYRDENRQGGRRVRGGTRFTQRRRTEAELALHRQHLEELVAAAHGRSGAGQRG